MERTILLANPGSTSRRYALYRTGSQVGSAYFDAGSRRAVYRSRGPAGWSESVSACGDLSEAPLRALEFLGRAGKDAGCGGIDAWGVRIVAPGSDFQRHAVLDASARSALEAREAIAPLHLGPALEDIRSLGPLLEGRPLVGLSDSAFHAGLPPVARLYAIPAVEAARLDLYRFGYHGLSVQSAVRRSALPDGSTPGRMLVCHLGGGTSITAVRDGRSVETSMGFSPLEGLMMATRAGDIDAGAVFRLEEGLGLDRRAAEAFLYRRCGLLGVSGRSGDVRELLALEADGERDASLALDAYAYRVRKYLGAGFAVLGGLDLIVFTAAIGERSPGMRARICGGLSSLGIRLDGDRNAAALEGDAWLHAEGSSVAIRALENGEMDEMARGMAEALAAES